MTANNSLSLDVIELAPMHIGIAPICQRDLEWFELRIKNPGPPEANRALEDENPFNSWSPPRTPQLRAADSTGLAL